MSTDPIVVEVVRSGSSESIHLVDVAVVDHTGAIVASAGEPERPAAFRSSAKPIQARVAREAGWEPAEERHLAVACASHNGEPEHVGAVRGILGAAGIEEERLRCPLDVPAFGDAALRVSARARVYHNCSGKHAAMLAACAAAGWPLEDYRAPDHPLQLRNRALLESLCGTATTIVVDGCGVPTFVAPIAAFARAFGAIDGGPEAAAMRAHPFLVGGSARFDSDLMLAAPHVLAKAGAEGLSCVAAAGLGIAAKARDGDRAGRARGPAVLLAMRLLGLLEEAVLEKLAAHVEPAVLGGGEPVGTCRARGSLDT